MYFENPESQKEDANHNRLRNRLSMTMVRKTQQQTLNAITLSKSDLNKWLWGGGADCYQRNLASVIIGPDIRYGPLDRGRGAFAGMIFSLEVQREPQSTAWIPRYYTHELQPQMVTYILYHGQVGCHFLNRELRVANFVQAFFCCGCRGNQFSFNTAKRSAPLTSTPNNLQVKHFWRTFEAKNLDPAFSKIGFGLSVQFSEDIWMNRSTPASFAKRARRRAQSTWTLSNVKFLEKQQQ